MHYCVKHPDRVAKLFCQKTGRWLCDECGAHCDAPKAYCKFRTACVIWALEHDADGDLRHGTTDGDLSPKPVDDELERLKNELEEARQRLPAHTVRPHQIMEIEELENRIADLERELGRQPVM